MFCYINNNKKKPKHTNAGFQKKNRDIETTQTVTQLEILSDSYWPTVITPGFEVKGLSVTTFFVQLHSMVVDSMANLLKIS